MKTFCPNCSQSIAIDPETLASLQGTTHFECPACTDTVAVPLAQGGQPVAPLRNPDAEATSPLTPIIDRRGTTLHAAHRGMNRNLLILGSAALLVLGGLGFFLASRKSGDAHVTNTNINNEIINNSYFTQLIASGVTTMKDLESIAKIRPYGNGFIGISKESLDWKKAQELAMQADAEVLSVDQSEALWKPLHEWLRNSFKADLTTFVWARLKNDSRILDGTTIRIPVSPHNPSPDLRHKVLLQWQFETISSSAVTDKPTTAAGDWIDLQDVSKWKGSRDAGFPDGAWGMEGGALRNFHGANDQYLETREKFRNFELEFEWKFSTGGNSGIFYGQREFQLVDDASNPNGKLPVTSCGALCNFIPPNAKKRIEPAGNYNRGKLVVSGNHVEHWINGEIVVDYALGSPELEYIVESGQFKNLPGYRKIDTTSGDTTISLQSHGGNVWFRNIRIRHLGLSSLRNAVLATKPARPFTGTFPDTIWFVRDSVGDEYYFEFLNNGVLNYEGKSGLRPNGKWRQEGTTVIIEINDGVAKLSGTLDGRQIRGDAQSTTAGHWTWEAVPR